MSELTHRLESVLRPYPPRRYQLDDYKRWFPTTGAALLRNLKRFSAPAARQGQEGGTIGVVVVPWVSTPVPWYAIMLAIGLARRGRKVVLLWDDTGFPELHLDEQNRVIGEVLDYVGELLPVMRLSDGRAQPSSPTDGTLVDNLVDQNLTWTLRGAPPTERDQSLAEDIRASLTRTLPLVRKAFDRSVPDCLVVPGGVYGTSGLFLHEGVARGCRVATFDTDRRIAQICASGVAAQNADIPRAFHAVWETGGEARSEAVEIAQAEFQSRTDNRDGYGFQALPATGSGSGDAGRSVLMPLNVEWDTAALGRHVNFENTVDWVTSTIAAILESDAGPVIVRQHPSERRKLQRSQLDIASVLHARFGDDPRCRFVAADDPVSSYDLLRNARLVLPYVSTIAIEAAAIGKPVLISGNAYFSDLGFVWSAGSREEYFALLRRGLQGDLPPLPEQSDRAWICYYLTAVRNRIPTDFTPHPDDFWSWCRRAPDSLFADPEVSDILQAIDGDVPVSLLRHRRISSPNGDRQEGEHR
jgi:hypothetical protein